MRVLLVAVLLCASAEAGTASAEAGYSHKKRHKSSSGSSAGDMLVSLAELLHIRTPPFVYNSDSVGSRQEMIDALWAGDWAESVAGRFSAANPALQHLLEKQVLDDADTLSRFGALQGQSRWEAVMSALFRARSQKMIPIETAALSIMWLYYRVPKPVWQAVTYFSKSVMSRFWVESLCDEAIERDPGPSYPVAEGLTAAVFDNLMMNVGYSSHATSDSGGRKIEMTNWATVFLPAATMPPSFTGMANLLGAGGIFRRDIGLEDFIDGFSQLAPDIVSNKKFRWKHYLDLAANGNMWEAVHFVSPYPPTKFHFHNPIFDRLQSSYADVNFEVDLMRGSVFHKFSEGLMLGGDGLSYMRLIHRLAQDPRRYLETMPIVVPRMGENPHGLYHFMHGDWRIWAPLLMRLAAVVGNRQVKSDPTIVDFNSHEHFLRIVSQACAEYVVEIARTGTSYDTMQPFLADAERNLSFGYIVFFLHLFAFKYLEYKNAVRRNASKQLDMLWRENLCSTRTAKANKTNYRQMSVILVYWGAALVLPLQEFYHNTRTIRWIHSHVGWDMPIEKLNMWIKESVVSNISEFQIIKFIARLNFLQHVVRIVKSLVYSRRARDDATQKDIKADVALIKEFLRARTGTTYATATQPSDANLLGVDMSDWGGLRRPRACAPFNQVREAQGGYRSYVRRQLAKLCPWHHWSS